MGVFLMLKQTLLKTLYYELSPERVEDSKELLSKDRHFHILERKYNVAPTICKVRLEERFLPYSVMYYMTINDSIRVDEFDEYISQWILSFFQENKPEYLREDIETYIKQKDFNILECFNLGKIPDYRKKYAYSDLTITRMEDIRSGNIKEDERRATFPGIQFKKPKSES